MDELNTNDLTSGEMRAIGKLAVTERAASSGPFILYRVRFHPVPRFEFVSESIVRILGYQPADFYNDVERARAIVHPEDREITEVFSTDLENISSSQKFRVLSHSGQTVWIEHWLAHLEKKNGKVVAAEGFVLDITDSVLAEESLMLNESRLKALLQLNLMADAEFNQINDFALDEGVRLTRSTIGFFAFVDNETSVLTMHSWSKSALEQCQIVERPLDYPIANLVLLGEPIRSRRPVIVNDYASLGEKKGLPFGHAEIRRALGVPVCDGDKVVALAFVANKETDYDDTDAMQLTLLMDGVWRLVLRKRAEEERRELEMQLGQKKKMEALGHFASGIAHDFNNLVTVILGTTQLLRRVIPIRDPIQEEFGTIERTAERAAELTRGLLSFARRQLVQPQNIDLNELIKDVIPMLRRLIPENIDILWRPGDDLGVVNSDQSQLEQIIVNLVVNARDAMPSGGILTLTTGKTELDESYVARHSWARAGKYVWVEVRDTGQGMDESVLAHVFEPFFSTKAPTKGTGLGLATVYGAVKQNSGIIDAVSAPGQGSRFTCYFPRVEAVGRVAQHRNLHEASGVSRETVLIVEDLDDLRFVLARFLSEQGYTVLQAENGRYAQELLTQKGLEIDAVITDLVMPELGGIDLYHDVRDKLPDLVFLFCSGYSEQARENGIPDEPRVAFEAKPYRLETLQEKLRYLLDNRKNPTSFVPAPISSS